jgi:hypothetical protein
MMPKKFNEIGHRWLLAAWVLDMFCNFYLLKNHKIANVSVTSKALEKISEDLESFF